MFLHGNSVLSSQDFQLVAMVLSIGNHAAKTNNKNVIYVKKKSKLVLFFSKLTFLYFSQLEILFQFQSWFEITSILQKN